MYLQTVVRFVIVCFLAIEARVVRADDPTVSLVSDDADILSPADRRRIDWGKVVKHVVKNVVKEVKEVEPVKTVVKGVEKVVKWVKRCYYKIHVPHMRKCQWNCQKRCRWKGRWGIRGCMANCGLRCLVTSRVYTCVWKKIRA